MNGNFDWVKFYVDFADKLYEYKDNRSSLVQILSKAFYDKDKENFNRVLEENDIDPFTVFASFNSFSEEKRIEYIEQFIKAFEMDGSIIPNNFDGVPSAQPLQKRYYDHDSSDVLREVQNLWDLFVYSINYANDKTDENERLFCESFDVVKGMRGIGLPKLTAALFWIRPNDFMTLDANSFDFLKREYGIVDSDKIDGKDYLRILEECDNICKNENTDFKNFLELSHFAYCARKNEIKIWKISHGDLNEAENQKALEKQVVLVGWGDDNKQGRDFSRTMKIGDWFYLTLGGGSGIKLLGKIVSDVENSQIKDGWRERKYQLICYALNSTPYLAEHKKKWEPTGQSTCFEVKKENFELFETRILKPYFDMHLSDLIESQLDKRKDENYMNKNISDISLNTILYGPPGTGKTYNTVLYAVAICKADEFTLDVLKEKAKTKEGYEEIRKIYDELLKQGRIAFTTFHQSYGYEDFIEGIKPIIDENESSQTISYDVKPGVFKNFCEETSKQLKKEYGLSSPNKETITQNKVFIIDEINRGNVSKIFGELITLIEEEKRGKSNVVLPYSQKPFTVPQNVYILGTMNTADRSLSLMDTALRRRFDFIEMLPDTDVFIDSDTKQDIMVKGVSIRLLLKILNERIEFLYDREHTIGHAYFKELLQKENRDMPTLRKIFIKKIIPLLQEYFYDDYERIRLVLGDNLMQDKNMCFIKESNSNANKLFGNADIDMDTKTYTVNDKINEFTEERFIAIYDGVKKTIDE